MYWPSIYICAQEKQLEFAVIEIIDTAGASEYIPTFARHRITIETFCILDEDDLRQVILDSLIWLLFSQDLYKFDSDSSSRSSSFCGLLRANISCVGRTACMHIMPQLNSSKRAQHLERVFNFCEKLLGLNKDQVPKMILVTLKHNLVGYLVYVVFFWCFV